MAQRGVRMMRLSQLVQVLDGRLDGADAEFTAVSTDSRTLGAGDLFIALHGENFDGSQFVGTAAQSGAVAALVNRDRAGKIEEHGALPVVWVEDTRLALGKLAAYWRTQFRIPVIGVTGSNGKTTVKEMLASILREAAGSADAVLATQGNLNNDIGMPLTLLKLRSTHQYAVIEMGMNHAGEIDYLTRLAHPDVALINNAASAHLAGLGSVEGVARAKGEIFAGLGEQGVAVINGDDAHASLWRELARPHRVIEFGLDHHPDVRAQWHAKNFGAHMSVTTPQGEFKADLQVPGAHNVRNALAATAAACAINVPLAAISAGLERFGGVAGRLQRKAALRGATLIDDTYNANPASLRAALKVLMQAKGKKLLVLGDMGELGADAAHMHAEIGSEARNLGVDKLFALGDLSNYAVEEFGTGARHFERIEDLYAALEQELNENSTVLVKGSRFMKMERVVRHCTTLQ
jgi:UDP-N-acetylmuramoyl-tripeptide--D-alanyl-D-alanine ligase